MVYIHTKNVRGKKYYTLRMSLRKGKKVITKDLCNLGNDLSKIDLEKLEKKYKDKIRKSHKTLKNFLDKNTYLEKAKRQKTRKDDYLLLEQQQEIKAILLHYKNKFLKLDKLTRAEVFDNFILSFAVNSTSIEGNTINLKEASNLLLKDRIPKGKTLREVYDIQNTKKVVEWLKEKRPEITSELIIQIHDRLLENLDKRRGFRTHNIRILGQPFKPVRAIYIQADINLLLKWYRDYKSKLNPFVLATLFHHKFEKIHPFSDGNGRTGRVLMNHILDLEDYPPNIITKRFREDYLDVMNESDKALVKSLLNIDPNKYKKLIDFAVSEFKTSYWDIFLI